jgi:manganese transport protein
MPPNSTLTVRTNADADLSLLRSIAVNESGSWLKRLTSFLGPGYLVAVGYMDPGNWATDLAGGSAFGYALLWVIVLSTLMAITLQTLAVRLGVATGLDLAQACRAHYSKPSVFAQWILCEIAICATDLAEVLGTAIALKLLFDIPLSWGVTLTALDALLILWLQQRGFRYLEALIISLLGLVFVCLGITVWISQPAWSEVAAGFVPNAAIARDPNMMYLAIGIIGATVMPHNLYLHSSIVQTRRYTPSFAGRSNAVRYASIDIGIALAFAFLINAAILIMSAAFFHRDGIAVVTEIQDAYQLLTPLTGGGIACVLFALALLASGQSSTLTATLAGQIVMEGYMHIRLPAWARRLLTRSVAIIPALFVTAAAGDSGIAQLLVLTQVILSLQLPFAVIPLVRFTSNKTLMGKFVNPRWLTVLAWFMAGLLVMLNTALLVAAALR